MDFSRTDKYQKQRKTPLFSEDASQLNRELKKYQKDKIIDLMKISDKLLEPTYRDIHSFGKIDQLSSSALYAYSGTVFQWIETENFSDDHLEYAGEHVRILSGLYGLLRPFDQIYPYRLEMKTPLQVGDNKNLYQFWKHKITNVLADEKQTILNLASVEYTKAIDMKQLDCDFISIQFKERENNKIKTIGMYSKMARGFMAGRLIREGIENPQDIKDLNLMGYGYDDTLSSDTEWIFVNDRS